MFGFSTPLTAEQTATVAASKQVVYDGLNLALTKDVPREAAGILVDDQYGAAILRYARERPDHLRLGREARAGGVALRGWPPSGSLVSRRRDPMAPASGPLTRRVGPVLSPCSSRFLGSSMRKPFCKAQGRRRSVEKGRGSRRGRVRSRIWWPSAPRSAQKREGRADTVTGTACQSLLIS